MRNNKDHKEIIEGYNNTGRTVHSQHGIPKKIRNYWRNMMDSTQKRMSRGAQQISRMISWARQDNWRRKK